MSWRRPHVQVSADIRAEEVGDTSVLLSQTGIELGMGLVFWLARFLGHVDKVGITQPVHLTFALWSPEIRTKGDSRTEYLFPATSQGLRR